MARKKPVLGVVGRNMKRLRKKRDLTQFELADKSGVGLTTIKNIERGANTNPGLETLGRIAPALKSSIEELTHDLERKAG